MANVSLKHIYKVYPNGVKAVNDFNMEIQDKEFIVFVGPSGCGKSTTLRMIAGLEDITAGELRIGDEVVNDMEPKDRDIAMVFQNYALYPHMTVYENMAFGLKIRKVPKDVIHKKILEAAEILSITEYLDRKPKAMSGGQRQRVALGRAILREPKVFLLDEPLSNLDAKLRTQMRAEISKLHDKLKTTFIYVTHDQVEAMTMGTRIVVMKNGVVQQIEKPKDLYRYPANKFVAGFIGTPQMNFFEATLTPEGDNVRVKFSYTDSEVVVPYAHFLKVKPEYLDGKTVVTVGLRCEHISLKEEDVANASAVVPVKISHLEELGTETLVYGDLNMNGDGYSESSTRIIIKANGDEDFEKGSIVKAALNFGAIHLFDKETEESILPRVPKEVALPCEVKNNKLKFADIALDLPPAVHNVDAVGKVLIPLTAVSLGKTFEVKVSISEKIGEKFLNYLNLNGRMLFMMSKEPLKVGTKISIDIDFKQISVLDGNNEKVISALPVVSHMAAKFIRVKEPGMVETKKGPKQKMQFNFKFDIEGVIFNSPDEISKKILAGLSISAFESDYTIDVDAYSLKLADNGISGTIVDYLDYGKEKFLKVAVNKDIVYVATNEKVEGNVHLAVDFNNIGVTQTKLNMKLV